MFHFSHCSFQKQMQNFDITLPQEQQPAEMVDRREEQPPEMVDRREVNPAEMADRQEEQPPEMVDSRPTEMVDRQEVNPAEMADRREEQPAGMEDRRGQEEPRPVDTPEINAHFFKIILSPHASKLVSSASGFMMRHLHLISFFSVCTCMAYVRSFCIFLFCFYLSGFCAIHLCCSSTFSSLSL